MTNKNLKQIVEQIKKLAAPPPKPGQGYQSSGRPAAAPAGGAGAAPVAQTGGPRVLPGHGGRQSAHPAGHGGAGVNVKPIIDMQTALQNLAITISSTIDYDMLLKTMSTPPGQPSPEDQKDFQAQYGKDMFSNFMVGQYLRRADVHGVEYDTDPKRTKMLDKKPYDLKSMFVILDSMKRIGSESKESFADGNWGPRTNNALKNASAIATAISKLGAELGMQATAFDPGKIAELNGLIPAKDTDISITDKIQRSPKIADILNGVNALFKDFKQQVFMDPTYKNFIIGRSPMMTFGPPKEKVMETTEGEKPILADLATNGPKSRWASAPPAQFTITLDKKFVPVQFGRDDLKININGGDLVNQKTFENWANETNALKAIKDQNPASWSAVVKSVLDQVTSQVQQKLGTAT